MNTNPYNFWLPFVVALVSYLGSFYLTKTNWGKLHFTRLTFGFIWNTIMVLCLIPSAAFGIFMIARYSYPDLYNINFNFLYWHVEGGIVFSTLVLCHFITRIKPYYIPFVVLFKKKSTNQ